MNVTNERDWAAKTAMRLHIWQESFAADDPASRGAAVWQYISDALAELGETDERFRASSLRALDEEFPFYQERKVIETQSGEVATASVESLIESLLKTARSLPPDKREVIARKLADGGITIATQTPEPSVQIPSPLEMPGNGMTKMPVLIPEFQDEISRLGKTVEKIQSTLGNSNFKGELPIHLVRSMQILGLMTEQFLQLHPQVWSMWEKIVTNHQYTTSFHKPPLAPDESLAQFLLGAPSTKRADVGQMVSKTFFLALAAVTAVETAGKEFAAWFFDKFGPQNIESLVQYESQGSTTTEVDYWKRYLHLAETYSNDELAEQFLNLLGRNILRTIQTRKAA